MGNGRTVAAQTRLSAISARHEAPLLWAEVQGLRRGRRRDCRSRLAEAEGRLNAETPGRVGAALTKTGPPALPDGVRVWQAGRYAVREGPSTASTSR